MSVTVRLRPVELGDLEDVATFLAHPDLVGRRGLDGDRPGPRSVSALRNAVDSLVDPEHGLAWIIHVDGLAGLALAGWWWDVHTPWVHIVMDTANQRRGYGKGAFALVADHLFADTPALLIEYGVDSWDTAGLAFADSVGGERVGVRRRTGIREGRYHDRIEFVLRRGQWEARDAAGG